MPAYSMFVLGFFLKLLETITNLKVYTLLLNIDFIPILGDINFPEWIEFSFHIIISVILAFIFYYIIIRNKWNWQRILFYVSLGNMLIGLFIYPITLFSDRTPPLLSIFALNFLPVFHPIKSDLLRNCKNLSPGLRYGNGLFFLIIKTNKN